jgi:hypothetical protein
VHLFFRKISSSLYESILPLVKSQVSSQIKVRDLSKAMVSIQPADHPSWSNARADLIVEAKRYECQQNSNYFPCLIMFLYST